MIFNAGNGALTRATPLPFKLGLVDGTSLTSVGDVSNYLIALDEHKRDDHHWRVAKKMLEIAFREPAYFRAAIMSVQTALAMDGVLWDMHSIDGTSDEA